MNKEAEGVFPNVLFLFSLLSVCWIVTTMLSNVSMRFNGSCISIRKWCILFWWYFRSLFPRMYYSNQVENIKVVTNAKLSANTLQSDSVVEPICNSSLYLSKQQICSTAFHTRKKVERRSTAIDYNRQTFTVIFHVFT